MMRRVIISILLAFLPMLSWAQNIEVTVPNVVAVGETFRLEYRSAQQMTSVSNPEFGEMELLAGPSSAQYVSTNMVNGNFQQQTTYVYTYVLRCNEEGTFTASGFSAEIDGSRITANSATIKALNESSAAQSSPSQGGQSGQSSDGPDDDLIIRAVVDKTNVYKGEAIRVTFKLYTRVDNIGAEGSKMPSFNGFWTQEIEVEPQRQREALGNKIYSSQVLREYLLFPQATGTLTIEPFSLDIVAQLRVKRPSTGDIFEDMMFGTTEIREVRRKVSSPAVTINVKALPTGAPESFDGAVGEFTMTADPLPREIAANSAISRIIRIEGSGNLSQIQAPKLKFPDSFEQYSVKTTDKIQSNARGMSGSRMFEYPFIARAEGEYVVPAVEFTFFSPRQTQFVTLRSQQSILTITPDSMAGRSASAAIMGGVSKEDIRLLGKDIRFIQLGAAGLHREGRTIVGNGIYLLCVILMGSGVAVLYFYLRKVLRDKRDNNIMKGKYANKVALRRFRQAEIYMNEGNQRGFYEEMLRGLWGYMADKYNIPVANLTKVGIREKALKQGIANETIESYIAIIGECEYGQYSPSSSGQMIEEYKRGIEAITAMENRG